MFEEKFIKPPSEKEEVPGDQEKMIEEESAESKGEQTIQEGDNLNVEGYKEQPNLETERIERERADILAANEIRKKLGLPIVEVVEPASKTFSRRDFLKLTGSVLASSFFGALEMKTSKIDAKREKNIDYLGRIKEIKRDILTDKEEKLFIYTRSGAEEKERDFSKRESFSYGYVTNKLKEFLKEKPDAIEFIHTHPLESFRKGGFLNEEKIGKIKNGQLPMPSMPPSQGDILTSISMREICKSNKTKIVEKIIDPSGVWEYSVNPSHGSIQRLSEYISEYNKKFELLKENKSVKNWLQKNEHLKRESPQVLYESLHKEFPHLDNEAQGIIKEIYDLDFRSFSSPTFKVFLHSDQILKKIISSSSKQEKDKLIKDYIELNKLYGINIKYDPFEDLENKSKK